MRGVYKIFRLVYKKTNSIYSEENGVLSQWWIVGYIIIEEKGKIHNNWGKRQEP